MRMGTSMTGFGRMIKPVVSEYSLTSTMQSTKGIGKKTSNTVKA